MAVDKDLLKWTMRFFQVGHEQEPKCRSFILTVLFSLTLSLPYQSPILAQVDQRPIRPWVQEVLEGREDQETYLPETPAVKAITERGGNALFDELIPLLNHPNTQIRLRSAQIFGHLQESRGQNLPDRVLQGLMQTLSDPEYNVRASAASAIATFGERAVPLLIKNLDNRNRIVRFWSIDALGKIGPPAKEAAPSLINTYRTGESPYGYPGTFEATDYHQDENNFKEVAGSALAYIWVDADSVPPFLIEQFDLEPTSVVFHLAKVGATAVPFLNSQLKHEDFRHRCAALDALSRIPNTDDYLHSALKNSEVEVRYMAAEFLRWRKNDTQEAIPYLLPLLKDDVLKVRRAALVAILHIGTTEYDKIAEVVLASADMEDDVGYFLEFAREDAANEKLIRILLVAYSDGNTNMQNELLYFFDLASFDQVEPILTRCTHDESEVIAVTAKQMLTRKQKAKRRIELSNFLLYNHILTVSYDKQVGFGVGYAIGSAVALRNKFESILITNTLEFLR